jgi:hypothetical protein
MQAIDRTPLRGCASGIPLHTTTITFTITITIAITIVITIAITITSYLYFPRLAAEFEAA